MALIEKEALKATLKRVKWLSDADGLAAVQLVSTAPTIDPIHEAGGCYCRECRYYHKTSFSGEYLYRLKGPVRRAAYDFCSSGEPEPPQDGGKEDRHD